MIVQANGIQLYYEQAGSGPDLLLIPGLGASVHVWHAQFRGLASVLRVTAFDPRGHGRSDRPAGPYTISQMADDAAGLLRGLGLGPAIVAGSSMSSMAVVELAARYPDLVSGIILVGGFASVSPAVRERMEERIRIAETEGMGPLAEKVAAGALGAHTHAAQPALVGLFQQAILANDPHTYAAAIRAITTADVTPLLCQVKCPTLLLLGEEEAVAPLPSARALKAGVPHAQVRVIPRAGHLPFLEQPALFNAAVQEWILSGCA